MNSAVVFRCSSMTAPVPVVLKMVDAISTTQSLNVVSLQAIDKIQVDIVVPATAPKAAYRFFRCDLSIAEIVDRCRRLGRPDFGQIFTKEGINEGAFAR